MITAKIAVDMTQFNRELAACEARMVALLEKQQSAPDHTGVGVGIVMAGMAVAGSTRTISRRSLLGLGWLKR